jgi:hypothetical protein
MPSFNGNGDYKEAARRRALERLPEKMQAEQKSAERKEVAVRQSRAAPARFTENRCKVCTSPHRNWVENMIGLGHSPSAIERAFQGNPEGEIPRRSVATHSEKHMDIQDTAMRAIIEQEARLEGRNFDEGMRDLLTKKSMFEIMMRKAFKDVQDGTTTVEPRDMIQMAKILGEWETGSAAAAVEEYKVQMHIFLTAIKNVFGPEDQIILGREVKRLRKLEGLGGKVEEVLNRPQLEPEYVDATIVPDTD